MTKLFRDAPYVAGEIPDQASLLEGLGAEVEQRLGGQGL